MRVITPFELIRKKVIIMNLLENYKQYPQSVKLNYDPDSKLTVAKYIDYNFDVPHIMDARGLVLDENGNIVARPYKKFFNYKELADRDIDDKYKKLSDWHDGVDYDVTLKVDGSLVIMFYYNGKWMFSSGSTLKNEYVKWFNNYMDKILSDDVLKTLEPYQDKTILLEYCSPKVPLVIYYNKEQMVLHGIVDTKSGIESNYNDVAILADKMNLPVVKRYDVKSLDDLLALKQDAKGIEGFVISFSDGHKLKMKVQDYYDQKYSSKERGVFSISKMASPRVAGEFAKAVINDEFDDILALIENNPDFSKKLVKEIASIPDMYKQVVQEIVQAQHEQVAMGRDVFAIKYANDEYHRASGLYRKSRKRPMKRDLIYKRLVRQINKNIVDVLMSQD